VVAHVLKVVRIASSPWKVSQGISQSRVLWTSSESEVSFTEKPRKEHNTKNKRTDPENFVFGINFAFTPGESSLLSGGTLRKRNFDSEIGSYSHTKVRPGDFLFARIRRTI
jgi:hypothetical protein